MSLWSTCAEVQEGHAVDHGCVLEPKKPWASSNYSVLTLFVSGCVDLDWPSLGGLSGVFLVVKEVGSRG
jgi:hypothetical protein